MEIPDKYKKIQVEKPNRIYNGDQALCLEIAEFFHKKISFGRVAGLIKKSGRQKVFEAFSSVRQSEDVKNPPALFLWKCTH